jgi:hypothetical protein
MSPEVINTVGLASNMAGVVVAFFYGFPQPSHEEGVFIVTEEATPDVTRRRKRYKVLSQCGLGLMFVGFGLQLLATWIARGG